MRLDTVIINYLFFGEYLLIEGCAAFFKETKTIF